MILKDVVAAVSTKNRTNTTLPLVITSILCSSYKPGKLIIYDDNDELKDPRESEIYKNLLSAVVNVGIEWFWLPGVRRGQIHNHERARVENNCKYIWRIDDDNILPGDVLETLYKFIETDEKIGAVGPSILDPKSIGTSPLASNAIKDVYLGHNIQWNYLKELQIKEVEHLQGSTFLYRRAAAEHGYELSLSRVGHREETIFTYEMFRNGWKLYAICGLNTWHMRYGSGGIRTYNEMQMFEHDEYVFREKLKKWGVDIVDYKFVYLNNGRGDHYAFKQIIPELVEKYKDKKITIGACFPEVFWDIKYPNVYIMRMGDVEMFINKEEHSIYKFMGERQWKQSIVEAFRKMYL